MSATMPQQQTQFQQMSQMPQMSQRQPQSRIQQPTSKRFPPSQSGKSRPPQRGISKVQGPSDELKEILTGLKLEEPEATAIATDLEDVIGSGSESVDEVRNVRVNNNKRGSITLA